MNLAQARRQARAELADHAMRLAEAAESTAQDNGRDIEGARDAGRMAAAHRALASMLDPQGYPPPARTGRIPNGATSLVTPDGVPIEEMDHG